MGLECGWCHAGKRWSWEFKDFEKESVEIGPERQRFDVMPLSHRVEIGTIEMRVGFWPLKDIVRFFRSPLTKILNITRCAVRGGGVNIVWLAKTFKNYVSHHVTMDRSQKLIIPFVSETTEFACVLYLWIYFITVVTDLITIYSTSPRGFIPPKSGHCCFWKQKLLLKDNISI